MKTKISIFAVWLLFIFTLYSICSAQTGEIIDTIEVFVDSTANELTSFGDDYLDDTVWIPDELGGCLPQDVCYNFNENKYYLYGGRRLVVIDGESNIRLNTITVSSTGSICRWNMWSTLPENRLAYNPINNKIYCATDGHELVVIDCFTDEIITIHTASEITNLAFTSVIYNETTNRVYWSVNDYFTYRKIKMFDGESDDFLLESNWTVGIYDLVCNPSGDKLFLSTTRGIKILNAFDFSIISQIYVGETRTIIYNSTSNKVYVGRHESHSLAVIDGISNTLLGYIEIPYDDTILMIYNPVDNKIYCTCNTVLDYGVIIIDGDIDEVIITYSLYRAISLVYNPTDNHIFCGGNDTIIMIDGTSDEILETVNVCGGNSYRLAYNSVENTLISANLNEGTAGIFNDNCNLIALPQIGGGIAKGCYNNNNNKIYFIQFLSQNENSFLSIIDGETNQVINTLDIAYKLFSCAYNYAYNKVYVSDRENNIVTVIDGQSDQVITTIQIDNVPGCLFSCPNNKIYSVCYNGINIIDGETDQIISTLNVTGWTGSFTYNPVNHKVYAALKFDNRVNVIDANNNTIINQIVVGDHPITMTYNSNNNKVYCANFYSNTVTIIDGATDDIIGTINISSHPFDITYSPFVNKIYSLRNGAVTVIDGDQDEIITEIYVEGNNKSLLYNPNNNRVYVHTMIANNLEMLVNVIDCDTDEICSTISLEQWQQPGLVMLLIENDMVYNLENNKVYTGNWGFSNVSVIQCSYPDYDNKILTADRWNWESFPVLPNPAGTNALDVLEPILDPDVLDKVVYENRDVIWYEHPNWYNNLEDGNFRSIDGYKIKMHRDAELEIAGVREDPGTVIHLYAEVDKAPWPPPLGDGNWIGYFIPGSQLWQFAFAQIWDKITFIKADDWSYISGYSMPPSLCTVDYGKLYIVGVSEDCSFTWGLGLQQNPYTKSETSIFYYQEQADYMPIFVDSTEDISNIDEIGVFLEDECISASKIEGFPVFIPAYIEDEDSTGNKDFNELTFQVATYGKVGKRSIPAFVYNETQNTFVEEPVILDAKSYAIVRLGTGEGIEFPKEFTLYQNYPNPFSPRFNRGSTMISFIPAPGVEKSEIKIYNIKGQLVRTLTPMTNDKSPITSIVWDGKDKTGKFLANGIYFYKLISGDKSAVKKMVIMR